MPAWTPTRAAWCAAVALCAAAADARGQQALYPDLLSAAPADQQVNVGREQGRKGMLFRFKFQDGPDPDGNAAFPLDLSTATVTLQLGAAPPLVCTAGGNPAPNAAGFVVVDGPDADGALDTVKIVFNGDLPANTAIQYSVSGARTTMPAVAQNADPHVVTFTTGNNVPRPPVAVELVVDVSGSMNLPAVPAGPVKRMDAVKSAAQVFTLMYPEYAMLNDKLGVVTFSTTATAFDPSPGGSNLESVQDTAKTAAIAAHVQSLTPTNATSIGGGLQVANTAGFAADPGPLGKKVVVLFSDGEQNTAPLVTVAAPNVLVGGNPYPADFIFPVTAGPQTAPGFALQQAIAAAKGTLNAQVLNAHVLAAETTFSTDQLRTHFTQVLTGVLVGDKVEVARDVSGRLKKGETVRHRFYANSTDVALSVMLAWSAGPEEVRGVTFRLIAPDSTPIDLRHRTRSGREVRFATAYFPLEQDGKKVPTKGRWTVEVSGADLGAGEVNYHLMALLDSPTLATDYQFGSANPGTGESIPVRVRVTDGGKPVRKATVLAEVLGPAHGLGDVLAKAKPGQGQPNIGEDRVRSAAQRKLLQLQADPKAADLFRSDALPVLPLLDNGDGATGDKAADDGIYSGVFTDTLTEGHYRFKVTVEGVVASGRFQRTQTLSVFVRPKPDAKRTTIKLLSDDKQEDGSRVVKLQAIPRDRHDALLGPDYDGLLRFRLSEGRPVGRLTDALDGSYEASFRVPPKANPTIVLELGGEAIVTTTLDDLS